MRTTLDIRIRQKRFAAFVMTLVIGVFSAVNVVATPIDYTWPDAAAAPPGGTTVNDLIGHTIAPGENIDYRLSNAGTGKLVVNYLPAGSGDDVTTGSKTYPNPNPCNTVASAYNGTLANFQHWRVSNAVEKPDGTEAFTLILTMEPVFPAPVAPEKKAPEQVEEEEPSTPIDPNAIGAFLYRNGIKDPKAKFGRQAQGEACKALFAASCPKGWNEGFSFSMSYDDKNSYLAKEGTLVLYIPGAFQKKGREYAVMAVDENGKVHLYNNTVGRSPFVFTSGINLNGYAFNLIYKD